ncbi:MAG: ATP-binding protein [Myxococcota bacterium]|nr:ATP-binding protein [Myxococcota bacterium]
MNGLGGIPPEAIGANPSEPHRSIVDASPMAIHLYHLEPNGKLTLVRTNQASDRIFGEAHGSQAGKSIEDAWPAWSNTEIPERFRFTASSGQPWQTEIAERDGDDLKLALEIHAFQVAPNQIAAMFLDITDRKRAEEVLFRYRDHLEDIVKERTDELTTANQELRKEISHCAAVEEAISQAHSQLEQVFNSAADGMCVIDATYTITRVNDSFPPLKGRSKDDLVGLSCHDVLQMDICNTNACVMRRIIKGENKIELDTMLECDGVSKPYIISGTPLRDVEGGLTAIILVFKDLSERKALERQLVQAQKLESIGQLAAGIAHEINTPTQYVGDNTRFLKDAFGDIAVLFDAYNALLAAAEQGPVSPEVISQTKEAVETADLDYLKEEIPLAIEQSLEGIERVSGIVRAMKEFSHPGVEGKTMFNLNTSLNTTITVARNEWKYVADVETDFDPALPMVPCLPGDFNQAILNIIVNAAHAIGDKAEKEGESQKGNITISTRQDGDFVEVRISDTGPGIPKHIQERIFDPFFTTKAVGKGTGQGLAIARSVVVDKHGGDMTFESTQGKGTTFIIRLPIQDASDDKDPDVPEPGAGA